MAEITTYQKKDLESASHCIIKSAECNPDNIQWRILLCKILLERFQDLISDEAIQSQTLNQHSTSKHFDNINDSSYREAMEVINYYHLNYLNYYYNFIVILLYI